MSKKSWLIAGVILVVGIALYFFLSDPGPDESGEKPSPATMEFHDTELNEKQNGNMVWSMKVKHMVLDAGKNKATLEGIDGYFKNQDIELTIKADRGSADRAAQTLYLEGHVEGTTTDGAVLHAENLTYDGKTGKLSTDKAFAAERDGRVLTADSFTADRILSTIEAKGHARLQDKEATN